jgi:hypothetical protein
LSTHDRLGGRRLAGSSGAPHTVNSGSLCATYVSKNAFVSPTSLLTVQMMAVLGCPVYPICLRAATGPGSALAISRSPPPLASWALSQLLDRGASYAPSSTSKAVQQPPFLHQLAPDGGPHSPTGGSGRWPQRRDNGTNLCCLDQGSQVGGREEDQSGVRGATIGPRLHLRWCSSSSSSIPYDRPGTKPAPASDVGCASLASKGMQPEAARTAVIVQPRERS